MDGFLMTLDQALEFYKRCEELKADTKEKRLDVLIQMSKEHRAFPQTAEQLKKRIEGKNVLRVKYTPGENNA